MEVKIPIEELQKRSIFLAVPMYGGQCSGLFAKSLADLSVECTKYGIHLKQYYLFNESLITRGRNYCAAEFLRSDCTHLMFIDSDIGFNAHDVLSLLALQSDDSPYDIITGPYPKKNISWEKVKQAVDKGAADKDPEALSKFVGDYVFNFPPDIGEVTLADVFSKPVEVLESGTGFMMIRRKTFEKFMEAYPEQEYTPDHIRSESFNGSRNIFAFFDTVIDPKTKRYLSEDYMFCQWCRNIGLKTYMCAWMQLQHVGSYIFGGSLYDLATVGANLTADAAQLKKKS